MKLSDSYWLRVGSAEGISIWSMFTGVCAERCGRLPKSVNVSGAYF
jgi:hypothetical protein